MRVYSAFLIALLFRQPEHPRIADGRRRGRAADRRGVGARGAAQFPAQRGVDPVQLLQLEDQGRHGRRADRARCAVARRSARDAAEPGVVARAPRVQPPDPGPLRRRAADDGRSRGDRARARAALGAVRDLLRGSRARSCRRATSRAPSRRSTSCARCSNPARRMDVAYFKFQESTVRMLEGRAEDALRAARDAVAIGRERGAAGDADSAFPRPRGAVASAARRRRRRARALRRGDRARGRRRRRQLPRPARVRRSARRARGPSNRRRRRTAARPARPLAASAATRASCASCPD